MGCSPWDGKELQTPTRPSSVRLVNALDSPAASLSKSQMSLSLAISMGFSVKAM
jgi:hypothetical protein